MPVLTSDTVGRPPAPPDRGGYGGGGDRGGWGAPRRAAYAGLVVLLCATLIVFAGFAAMYLMQRDLSRHWVAFPLPKILWLNTLLLLASSGLIEAARAGLRGGRRVSFNRYWTAGTAFGALFLLGQGVAWRELRDAGVLAVSNPAGVFFLLLTAAHAVHLLAGMTALVWVDVRALRYELGPARRTAADISALFWHFLDGLWIGLLALFSIWA